MSKLTVKCDACETQDIPIYSKYYFGGQIINAVLILICLTQILFLGGPPGYRLRAYSVGVLVICALAAIRMYKSPNGWRCRNCGAPAWNMYKPLRDDSSDI